jgi:hypothetical protein
VSERVGVDEEVSLAWAAIAHGTRVDLRVMTSVGEPTPGSNLAQVADLYPFERVSDRVRAYLMAGIEHMLIWADLSAPLIFHPDQVVNVTLRPAYTLARATMEASAQAVWLMDTRDPVECVRRHLSLIRWDLQEYRKSKNGSSDKQTVSATEDDLLHRVSKVFESGDIKPPRGYLEVIRTACDAKGLDLDADTAERLWRAASGTAHGKYWPTLELQRIQVGEEYEPGQHRTTQLPDPLAMTGVLKAASTMSQYGVVLFAQYSGADVEAILGQAMAWVAERIPLKQGKSREDLMNLQHALPWPDTGGGSGRGSSS